MPVPASINDLSTTAGSNSPAGSETPTEGDNYIRTYGSFIALLRDKLNGTSDTGTVKNATFSGTMAGAASWAALQTFAAGLSSTTGTFSGAVTASNILASTSTPTVSNKTNTSTVTTNAAKYFRIGSFAVAVGVIAIDVTAAAASSFQLSLPISSNLGAATDLVGFAAGDGVSATVQGNTTNDTAQFNWTDTAGGVTRQFGYCYAFQII
jgi:hypothetical protein